jgi:hypothetical protein
MPDVKVVVARPIALNLAAVASLITDAFGGTKFSRRKLDFYSKRPELMKVRSQRFLARYGNRIEQLLFQPSQIAQLDILTTWKEVFEQLSLIKFTPGPDLLEAEATRRTHIPEVDLGTLVILDPVTHDRNMGVCSIPLYDFEPADTELFHKGEDIESARAVLNRLDITQYFFPPADQLALGFVERQAQDATTLAKIIERVPSLGHPFGPPELVDPKADLLDTIASLQEEGLLAEGELGIEITEAGRTVRSTVKFRPRESIFAKIAHVFSVKVELSIKDLFK